LKISSIHTWDMSPVEAIKLQNRLRDMVSAEDGPDEIQYVAGLDVSIKENRGIGAAVILDYPDLQPVETAIAKKDIAFPYVPGLLSFREAPVLIAALKKLSLTPDLVLVDGQGIAHPRRLGIAAHLGVLTGLPTIGCGKTRLYGKYEGPGPRRGDYSWLYAGSEIIGAVVRTKERTNPIFISVGNNISLDRAIRYILLCTTTYRLPEPIRIAHLTAGKESPGGSDWHANALML
jgi:deoxyribonuclease V